MREIKFKTWDEGLGKMIYFDVKSANDIIDCTIYEHIMQYTGLHIMQYTGLKDKNGKEIYEGDIVNIRPYDHISKRTDVGEVFWMEAYHGWGIKCPDKLTFHSYHLYQAEEMEIIGNIYENPELLEKK